mgnify:CR=1 FL=1
MSERGVAVIAVQPVAPVRVQVVVQLTALLFVQLLVLKHRSCCLKIVEPESHFSQTEATKDNAKACGSVLLGIDWMRKVEV